MKKNGFTLVELLAVIVILAIIITIAVVSVTGTRNDSLQRVLDTKIEEIESGAVLYGQENPSVLTDSCKVKVKEEEKEFTKCKAMQVGYLLDNNYVESNEGSGNQKDLYNNVTNKSMREDYVMIYYNNHQVYALFCEKFNLKENKCN